MEVSGNLPLGVLKHLTSNWSKSRRNRVEVRKEIDKTTHC